jgi:hypothetical protein
MICHPNNGGIIVVEVVVYLCEPYGEGISIFTYEVKTRGESAFW